MKKTLLLLIALLSLSFNVFAAVNLNTATKEELESLKSVGPAKAQAIIDYRTKTPFKTVDDLDNVKGFGKKTVDKIRGDISVSGPTTVAPGAASKPTAKTAPAPAVDTKVTKTKTEASKK